MSHRCGVRLCDWATDSTDRAGAWKILHLFRKRQRVYHPLGMHPPDRRRHHPGGDPGGKMPSQRLRTVYTWRILFTSRRRHPIYMHSHLHFPIACFSINRKQTEKSEYFSNEGFSVLVSRKILNVFCARMKITR